ncbi:MAG: chorismate synthase [Candidatus Zhuqueibacterota bacterium]
MSGITWRTAGESHGKGLIGIIDGIPSGLSVSEELIQQELARRQKGYGRGTRMNIEKDRAEIFSGIRFGQTIGSPISVFIENKDWVNWSKEMAVWGAPPQGLEKVMVPRPGHADLAGSLKYLHTDIRNVIERASARESAARVALGAIARQLLEFFNIFIFSEVIQIGKVQLAQPVYTQLQDATDDQIEKVRKTIEKSEVHCSDEATSQAMKSAIDEAKTKGDSVGGRISVMALHIPVGLGSYSQWDQRLDGLLAQAVMSIPAIKTVEIGDGPALSGKYGSEVHDEIFWEQQMQKYKRPTNHAGGIEGGVSNGEPIIITATMKPIPTLIRPLKSVNIQEKTPGQRHKKRSDICAVPSASIIAEAMVALVLADQVCKKFGGDSIAEMKENMENVLYERQLDLLQRFSLGDWRLGLVD